MINLIGKITLKKIVNKLKKNINSKKIRGMNDRVYHLLNPFKKLQLAYEYMMMTKINLYEKMNKEYIDKFFAMKSSIKLNDKQVEILERMDKDGIAFGRVEDFFGEGFFKELQEEYKRLEETNKEKIDSVKNLKATNSKPYLIHLINKLHISDKTKTINKIVLNKMIPSIAAYYLGMIPRFQGIRLILNLDIPQDDGLIGSQQWHRDNGSARFFKAFIYLKDVDEIDGPFEYIKNTHYKGDYWDVLTHSEKLERQGFYIPDKDMSKYDKVLNENKIRCVGKAGDMVFADTSGIHRGGHCSNGGSRQIVMLHYFPYFSYRGIDFSMDKSFDFPDDKFMKKVFGLE